MDRRVVAGLVLVGVALLVGAAAAGAFEPLYTTEGYQPAPTATDGGAAAGAGTDDGARTVSPTASRTAGPTETYSGHEYEHVTVTVVDAETNETLGAVTAAVAETFEEKYTGLSKTESLPEDRGMLFVYDEPDNHTYVMREMDFGLDIVYVDANGTITEIHHAPKPPEDEDGEDHRYPGYGQYVLEVNYEWTVRHNVSEGDRIVVGNSEGNEG
jgi:uncharacterized membrane protein (UPF0127 family)